MTINETFQKKKIALLWRLIGANYHTAVKAFYLAEKYHNGLRKDGITPEFAHQVDIAHHILTLKDVANLEESVAIALLHDIREDYDITDDELRTLFGNHIANGCELVTKKFKGTEKDKKSFFDALSTCPRSSLVKGADRISNILSMTGVFTVEKQKKYIEEANDFFLPMLKKARHSFPEQTDAYLNIENTLKNSINLIQASLNSASV